MLLQVKECQRLFQPAELEERPERASPSQPIGGTNPVTTLALDFQPLERGDDKLIVG